MPALRKLARKNKRTATKEAEVAIERHLRESGIELPDEED